MCLPWFFFGRYGKIPFNILWDWACNTSECWMVFSHTSLKRTMVISDSNPNFYLSGNIVAGAFFGQRYNQAKPNIAKFLLFLEQQDTVAKCQSLTENCCMLLICLHHFRLICLICRHQRNTVIQSTGTFMFFFKTVHIFKALHQYLIHVDFPFDKKNLI